MRNPETSSNSWAIDPSLQVFEDSDQSMLISSSIGASKLLGIPGDALCRVLRAIESHGNQTIVERKLQSSMEPAYLRELCQRLISAGAVHRSPAGRHELESPHPLILLDEPRASARWSSELASKVLIIGDSPAAHALHGALERAGSDVAVSGAAFLPRVCSTRRSKALLFESSEIRDRRAGAKGGSARLPSARFLAQLRGRSFLVSAFEDMTFPRLRELHEAASKCDAFLLLVSAPSPHEIIIGPMIPPGLPDTIASALLCFPGVLSKTVADRWILHSVAEVQAVGLVQRAATLLIQCLSTPTHPLLWQRLFLTADRVVHVKSNLPEMSTRCFPGGQFSLERYLNPAVLNDREALKAIASSLRDGDLVSIKDAFDPAFAECLHRSLHEARTWKVHESMATQFHFHHHNIYQREDFSPELLTASLIFGSAATRRWAEALTGSDCGGPPSISASQYMPGDLSFPHDDASGQRSVAFVWHLTAPGWDPSWGGGLYWVPTGDMIRPDFNTLHLFNVSRHSVHFVAKVLPNAQGKRLTVNGWWNAESPFVHVERKRDALVVPSDAPYKTYKGTRARRKRV